MDINLIYTILIYHLYHIYYKDIHIMTLPVLTIYMNYVSSLNQNFSIIYFHSTWDSHNHIFQSMFLLYVL